MKGCSVNVTTKIICRISFFFLLGICSIPICTGQNRGGRGSVSFGTSSGFAEDTLYLDINQDVAGQLLPFEELFKVAVTHSPLVKYQSEVVNSLGESYEVAKLQILQNVSGFGNYSGGNQVLVSSGGTTLPGQGTLGQITNGSRFGVDLRIPLYEFFGRKHQIRLADANHKAAIHQRETVELQLKRDLIGIYQDMITTQQLLKILLIDEQASLTSLRVGEVEIQKGQITADMMASITTRYVQAKTASEQAKGSFFKNVRYFETLMGMPIQRLRRN